MISSRSYVPPITYSTNKCHLYIRIINIPILASNFYFSFFPCLKIFISYSKLCSCKMFQSTNNSYSLNVIWSWIFFSFICTILISNNRFSCTSSSRYLYNWKYFISIIVCYVFFIFIYKNITTFIPISNWSQCNCPKPTLILTRNRLSISWITSTWMSSCHSVGYFIS